MASGCSWGLAPLNAGVANTSTSSHLPPPDSRSNRAAQPTAMGITKEAVEGTPPARPEHCPGRTAWKDIAPRGPSKSQLRGINAGRIRFFFRAVRGMAACGRQHFDSGTIALAPAVCAARFKKELSRPRVKAPGGVASPRMQRSPGPLWELAGFGSVFVRWEKAVLTGDHSALARKIKDAPGLNDRAHFPERFERVGDPVGG
jgi:hypothetical protein